MNIKHTSVFWRYFYLLKQHLLRIIPSPITEILKESKDAGVFLSFAFSIESKTKPRAILESFHQHPECRQRLLRSPDNAFKITKRRRIPFMKAPKRSSLFFSAPLNVSSAKVSTRVKETNYPFRTPKRSRERGKKSKTKNNSFDKYSVASSSTHTHTLTIPWNQPR